MSKTLDPISLEIQWKRLVSMVDEASAAFVRTSFSVLVREANDFAVVLTDAQGRSIAQSVLSIPSFIGTLPATVKHFLQSLIPEYDLKKNAILLLHMLHKAVLTPIKTHIVNQFSRITKINQIQ